MPPLISSLALCALLALSRLAVFRFGFVRKGNKTKRTFTPDQSGRQVFFSFPRLSCVGLGVRERAGFSRVFVTLKPSLASVPKTC